MYDHKYDLGDILYDTNLEVHFLIEDIKLYPISLISNARKTNKLVYSVRALEVNETFTINVIEVDNPKSTYVQVA